MNKVPKNKLYVIFAIVLILTGLLVFCMSMMLGENNLIRKVTESFRKQEETEVIEDGIEYIMVDNTKEPMALVTISRQAGIESIQYGNSKENSLLLNCNGKKKVSIDLEITIGEVYYFHVISGGTEKTETVLFLQDYLDDYMQFRNEEGNIHISYHNHKDNITNYYKLGNDENWTQTEENITLSLAKWTWQQFRNVTSNNGTEVIIHAKQVDSFGNTVITSKTFLLREISEQYEAVTDVFTALEESGKTLEEYGFTASHNNCDYDYDCQAFKSRNFGAGHVWGSGSWSGTFTLTLNDVNKLDKLPNLIYTKVYLWVSRGADSVDYKQWGHYTEGTQMSEVNAKRTGYSSGAYYELENENKSLKQIDYLQFDFWGWDSHGGDSRGSLHDLVLVYNKK